jgi:hypothetical protein
VAAGASRGDGALRVFAGLVAAHALVQIACVASAVFRITATPARARGVLAVAVLASVAFASRFGHSSRAEAGTTAGAPGRLAALAGWVATTGALAWAVSLWARLWRLASARPSYDWDGLYYHLPALNEWAAAGRVHWIGSFPDVPFVNYPMAVEAHTFLLHQAFGLSPLVDALNLWYWPLALLAVVVLAGCLGARGPWPWLAGALVAGAPVMVCQGVTSYIDPAAASCAMAAIAASVWFVFDGEARPWPVFLWGAAVGLGLGTKGTGLPMGVVMTAAVATGLLWQRGLRGWRAVLRATAVGVGVAIAVGGYWYVRSAWHTGNPLHPIQVRLGHLVLVEGYDAAGMMRDNQPEWLRRRPPVARVAAAWLQRDAPIQGYAPIGGLGYLWPSAGVPAIAVALALALRRHASVARPPLLFAAALVAVLFVLQPAAWWSRFTVWVHVLGLACLATVLHWAATSRRPALRAASIVCAVAVVALAAWESERTLRIERERGRVAGSGEPAGGEYRSTADLLFPGLAQTAGFDRFLAAGVIARSRWSRAGTLLGGMLSTPLGHRRIVLVPDAPALEDLARLDAAGVQWLVWDVAAVGDVPEVLQRRAVEALVYAPSPDTSFRFLRLKR